MNPNQNKTPEGKVSLIAGIMVLCFEVLNIILMIVRNNLMLGQVIVSMLIMALAVYYIVTGKQQMDAWNEKHKNDR